MSSDGDFGALLREFEREHPKPVRAEPRAGDKVRGRIVSIGPERALVDLGTKAEGVIAASELQDADGRPLYAVGDPIEAVLLSRDDQTGTLILGTGKGQRFHDSSALEEAFHNRIPVEGLVTRITKGGVEIEVAGIRGFCPASQMDIRFVEDLEGFIGQRLNFRITRFQGGRRPDLVVSRRALLEEEQQARAEVTRASLQVGAVLAGRVTAVKDYGAFVDLGGVEGMVHVSELAHGRVARPADVLSVGQAIEVAVLRLEKSDDPKQPQRIALSLRALAPDPWQDAVQRFPAGTRVEGTVTRLQPFGAFVELAPGIEGLVHISELGAGRRVTHPHEVLEPGQRVVASVLGVDPAKRRIALSLDPSKLVDTLDPQARAALQETAPESEVGTFGALLRERLAKAHDRR